MSIETPETVSQEAASTCEVEPAYWGQTTDPSQHNPYDFRYLVHAFNPHARLNAFVVRSVTQGEGTVTDEVGDQSIDVFKEPGRLDERVSLSMSLIDQNHTATWGDVGIIVAAPESSVVFTSPTDAGAPNSHRDRLIAQGRSMGILSSDEILERSSPGRYNEIVALGQSGLRAVGFFYKVDSRKKPVDSGLAVNMLSLGHRTGLPVVEVPEENIYTENKVVRYTYMDSSRGEELRIFLGGMCYCAPKSKGRLGFRVVEGDTLKWYFPSPEKFEAAVGFALRTGEIGEAEANQILEDYRTADIERQTPTAYFDKDGKIDRVECLQYYGEHEVKLNISRHGIANKIQEGAVRFMEEGIESLSQYVTDRMIEAAIENLSPEKAESIRSWYEKVRPSIEGAWLQQNRARSRMGHRIIRRPSVMIQ